MEPTGRLMTEDCLAALDDQVCERLRRCTLCGAEAERACYTGIWAQGAPPCLCVAYVVCLACHSQRPWSRRLHALLAARYAPVCSCGAGDACVEHARGKAA